MCMFLSVCMFVHLSVRLYANFCVTFFIFYQFVCLPFVSSSDCFIVTEVPFDVITFAPVSHFLCVSRNRNKGRVPCLLRFTLVTNFK